VTTAVAGYAPIASPTFTGDPKAPTPTAGDNDTSIATTAFVTAAVAAGGGGTGAVRYDISQGLTAPQQTQGRQNISAAPFDAALAANLVINGAMDVSQENGTTQVTVTTGALKWVVDQFWIAYLHTANTAVFKGQQVAPPGSPNLGTAFPNCLQLTATTLSAMAGAGDFAAIATAIEGYRIARLGFGSATNLSPVTIGFWVYATIAGTMTVAIRNSATDRSYPANITINSPLTWEYKTVTIPGDATGTWLNTNGVGFYLTFCFGSNTTMQGANNTWSAGNFFATSATTNFFASNGNTVCLTGVSMWKGTEAPTAGRSALAMRTFDQEKFLCKRYYQFGQVTVDFLAVATTWVGTASFATSPEMRTVPVLSNVAGATANNVLSATPVQPSPIGAAQQVMPSAAGNVRTYWYGSILCDARLS
jgi:hypothetical protein